MNNFFIDNRKKISGLLHNSEMLILFSGKAPKKRGDEKYPYSPDRNFYYLTGICEENIIFVMYKYNDEVCQTLFLQRFDEIAAKWTGEVLRPEKALNEFDMENIEYIDNFKSFFSDKIFRYDIKTVYLDFENREFNEYSEPFLFAEKAKRQYPFLNFKNCYYYFADLRKIKTDFEIQNIKKAIQITKNGIYSMMKNCKPEMFEYEIEAYFDFEVKKGGANDKAFNSIAASGKNATVLHYSKNNSKTKNGDLILFDVGAQYGFYNADITRTFPVNGKFTERQKVIYNIVLRGQQLVIDSIKPDVPFSALNNILKEFYFAELKKIGLIGNDETIDAVSQYYYHGVSHLLGLETHDAGRHNEGLLKKGFVLTVEPGLYISEENIGIRIEDNVFVTENGCEVLSGDIIKSVSDIENFMAEK